MIDSPVSEGVKNLMASNTKPVGDPAGEKPLSARVILQQCLSARLMVQPPTEDTGAQFVEIERGLIVYVCFLKGAEESIVEKMAKTVLETRLSENETGKRVSVLDLPGDILIIPQATLGGNLKGKVMQYHRNIAKDQGLHLYSMFVQKCEEMVSQSEKSKERRCVVRSGTYGNRQVFQTDTNGPYTHALEF